MENREFSCIIQRNMIQRKEKEGLLYRYGSTTSRYLFCVYNEVHFIVAAVYLDVLVSVSQLPHECSIL